MTGRLPFNPDSVRGPDPGEPAAGRAPVGKGPDAASSGGALSVAEAALLISRVLERELPQKLRIVGEISNFNERTHWYFRLKDADAVLDCVMFNSTARRTGFVPRDGQKVVLAGRVEFYAKQGRTQFYAEKMEALGAGDLEQRFRELVEELRGLGWLDDDRKRPLPRFPARVAIVTSRTGAALQDVLTTMQRRCPGVDVCLVDVRVQGDGAAAEIARAIDWLSRSARELGLDALLVTRGGGSIEDLWAFNERLVAQAIVRCSVPVVAAIGHETDTTIAELVADLRCSTPTQAATRLAPDSAALSEQIDQLGSRLFSAASRRRERGADRLRGLLRRQPMAEPRSGLLRPVWRLREASAALGAAGRGLVADQRLRVERLAGRLEASRPQAVLAARRALLSDVCHRLDRVLRERLAAVDVAGLSADLRRAMALAHERRRQRVESLERELLIAGPASVLRRGYSVTTGPDGAALRSASAVRAGDVLTTRLADGSLRSVVEASRDAQSPGAGPWLHAAPAMPKRSEPAAPPPRPTRRRGNTSADPARQMDLFNG